MPTKTVMIYKLDQLQPGDVVLTEDTFEHFPTVQRDVHIEPFVPDPEVWRERTNEDMLSGRHVVAVKGTVVGELYTYYVRKDED